MARSNAKDLRPSRRWQLREMLAVVPNIVCEGNAPAQCARLEATRVEAMRGAGVLPARIASERPGFRYRRDAPMEQVAGDSGSP
jgi:hypothetical protein